MKLLFEEKFKKRSMSVDDIWLHRGSPDHSTSVLCVLCARRYAYDKIRDLLFKYFTPKLGIEQMNRVPGKIEIKYLLVDVLNAL